MKNTILNFPLLEKHDITMYLSVGNPWLMLTFMKYLSQHPLKIIAALHGPSLTTRRHDATTAATTTTTCATATRQSRRCCAFLWDKLATNDSAGSFSALKFGLRSDRPAEVCFEGVAAEEQRAEPEPLLRSWVTDVAGQEHCHVEEWAFSTLRQRGQTNGRSGRKTNLKPSRLSLEMTSVIYEPVIRGR